MTEEARKKRNNDRLAELFPTFSNRIAKVIQDLEARGLRPRIQDAYRSPEDQLKAFNAGHSKLKFGFHNITGQDGEKESLAVDMLDDDHPLAPPLTYLLQLAAVAEGNGLTTGVRWGLPVKLRTAIDAAIAAQQWNSVSKVGWDPTHIQPIGISVKDAKAGKRPL